MGENTVSVSTETLRKIESEVGHIRAVADLLINVSAAKWNDALLPGTLTSALVGI